MADLENWNYLIGFGLILLGLVVAAHPSTPLGRGRGVVVGMLGCFLIGLLWICTFYVISDNLRRLPVFNDLGQYNLLRRHRLHGRRLHLRHPLGVAESAQMCDPNPPSRRRCTSRPPVRPPGRAGGFPHWG